MPFVFANLVKRTTRYTIIPNLHTLITDFIILGIRTCLCQYLNKKTLMGENKITVSENKTVLIIVIMYLILRKRHLSEKVAINCFLNA